MKLYLSIFLTVILQSLFGQEILPLVENYSKQDYNGDNQVWDVVQGNDNAMYFANTSFLVRYDGVKWEKYTLPNKTIIRSVFAFKNKIYTGSYNEFGYWERINGKMIYKSLSNQNNFFEKNTKSEEIWKIFELNGIIYFQSFDDLFVYQKNGKIDKIIFPYQISYCYIVKNIIYAASVRKGIFKFNGKEFLKVEEWSDLENNIICGIQSAQNETFFFTQKSGVFYEKNEKILSWNHPINEKLKKQIIITAKIVNETVFIGTAFNGLYVVNLKTNEYYNINRNNSLRNNTVLSINFDKENDVWLGLDNGISHIVINSSYAIFSDNSGELGTVYAIVKSKNGYLLGTNHGLFESTNNTIKLVPNSQGQIWDIQKVNDKYIVGHNEGAFEYSESDGFIKLNDLSGGWRLKKDKFSNNYIQSNYTGLFIYDSSSDFVNYKKINDKIKPIKDFVQINPNTFFVADNYRGLFKIELDINKEIISVRNISNENKIENDFGIKIFAYKNTELFYINNSWYYYDAINEKLKIHEGFNSNFKNVQEIIPLDSDIFIINKEGLLYVISQIENRFIWDLIPQKYYLGKLINNETRAFKIDNSYLLNMDDGFLKMNIAKKDIKSQKITVEAFVDANLIQDNAKINYNSQLDFFIISQYFGNNKTALFYMLDDEAMKPIQDGIITLKKIDSDNHKLAIYYFNGEKNILAKTFNFTVLNPWYWSFAMKIVYVFMFFAFIFLYYKWNKIKYLQKLKVKEEELKFKNEILKLEIEAENKLKIEQFEKHVLENQVQVKASELAGKSFSIVKQTELIENIKNVIEEEVNLASLKSKISKIIKINAPNKNEWKSFEDNLLKSNEDFVQLLTSKYDNLTSKDIKLCIYLKMNLSSKEIAPLMNISYRGVDLHRYRLRKKINLNTEVNLNHFMNNIK